MKRTLVLGSGMVGSMIAADLAADETLHVAVADRSRAALDRCRDRCAGRCETIELNCADPAAVRSAAAEYDLVVGALASHLGYGALEAVIEAGRDFCDISFMPEDALALNTKARSAGVTAIVDCGVAPGMSNFLAALGARRLAPASRISIAVGGVPEERRWPFEYKAGFAPADVVEEYTRIARFRVDGRMVEKPALTDVERVDVPGLGTLEAFNTDGLRTLLRTLDVPTMVEKTMRYPGHAALMEAFRAAGMFSLEPIEIDGATVRPRDVFAAMVFPQWTYQPGEVDLTVMKVVVDGEQAGRPARLTWDLLDRADEATGDSSMSRTTAFPCAIVARMIAEGVIRRPGVAAPEVLAEDDDVVQRIFSEHQKRGVDYVERIDDIRRPQSPEIDDRSGSSLRRRCCVAPPASRAAAATAGRTRCSCPPAVRRMRGTTAPSRCGPHSTCRTARPCRA
jgi:lysine 6-dehydrogenase